ncbi:MAG TPA: hypothetical protein PLU52_02920 [Opitutaceae bacterium]|nr:hypothetical protein [Opitutaceae bacterium]HND60285.1 hypothetical protein [Opitutaceae bacterium]
MLSLTGFPFLGRRSRAAAIAGLGLMLIAAAAAVTSSPYWNWRNPLPHGNDFNAVAYGGGQFVAVGRGGAISCSPDGQNWTTAISGTTVELTDVVYGNGRFVVASYALNGVLVSNDGRTWIRPAIPPSYEWLRATRLAFGAGRFVVAGDSGYVASSTDGSVWSAGASGLTSIITDIAFGGDRFVAVTHTGESCYSTDGQHWIVGGPTATPSIIFHTRVAYGDGRWLALGSGRVATSTNGTTWTRTSADLSNESGWVYDALAYFRGRFYAWGAGLPLLSSVDGTTWRVELETPNPLFFPNALAASSDRLVAAGRFGGLRSSADGATWANHTVNTVNGDLRSAAYGAGRWIAAGTEGLAVSTDTVTWRMLPNGTGYNGGVVAYGNGRFLATTSDGGIGQSLDGGETWTRLGSRPAPFYRLMFAQGRFIAAVQPRRVPGEAAVPSELISSTDGVSWSPGFHLPGDQGSWRDIAWIDGVFVAVGTGGNDEYTSIARSEDGINWTTTGMFPDESFAVGARHGLFVIPSVMGNVLTSPDGITWTMQAGHPLQAAGPVSALTVIDGRFVGASYGGKIVTSDDGVTWSIEDFSGSGLMWYIATGGDQVVAVGNAGSIWQVGTARFVNNATRARVSGGSGALIAGFVVTGTAPKTMLIRGVGPTLADYQVADPLAAPVLKVNENTTGQLIASNRGWQNASDPAALAAAARQVGAFALRTNGADSALLLTLPPGVYTATVTGDGAASGVALAEVYEVGANSSRIINMSTRANVGTGADVLIPGLVIGGDAPRRVLVRAVGPTLASFGVESPLSRPVLTLLSGQTAFASNQGWGTADNATDIAAVAQQVGGFPLPVGSADSALLVTLNPGVYSLHVTGANGTTGVALVEVYEVP